MSESATVDVLNDLLDAEYGSLVARLRDADAFVSWASAADRAVVERVLADVAAHQRALVELILRKRGAPVTQRYHADTTGYHFVTLEYLMPAVLRSMRELVRAYESASTDDAEAGALIRRHLEDHRRHLAALERLHGDLLAKAGG